MNDLELAWQEMEAKREQEDMQNPAVAVPIQTAFQIDTEEKASWVIGKRNALESKKAILKAQYDAMKKDIENDLRTWDYVFMEKLKAFVRGAIPHGKKHIKFLTGTAGFRKGVESLEIENEADAMKWAETYCPEAIKTEKRLLVSALKEKIKETGEVPPGTKLNEAGENFYVREESK